MRKWIKPEIVLVTLEPEEDVLSYCYSASAAPSHPHCSSGPHCFSA